MELNSDVMRLDLEQKERKETDYKNFTQFMFASAKSLK